MQSNHHPAWDRLSPLDGTTAISYGSKKNYGFQPRWSLSKVYESLQEAVKVLSVSGFKEILQTSLQKMFGEL